MLYKDQFRLDMEITSDLGEDRIYHCGFLDQMYTYEEEESVNERSCRNTHKASVKNA